MMKYSALHLIMSIIDRLFLLIYKILHCNISNENEPLNYFDLATNLRNKVHSTAFTIFEK